MLSAACWPPAALGELLRQPVDAATGLPAGVDAIPTSPAALAAALAALAAASPTANASVNASSAPAPAPAAALVQAPAGLLQAEIVINGVLSSCGAPSAGGCSFAYTAAATPLLSSVQPTALIAGQVLALTGSGFNAANPSANHVWLGGAECAVTAASSTRLACTTAASTAAGEHEVRRQRDGGSGVGGGGHAACMTLHSLLLAAHAGDRDRGRRGRCAGGC